MGRLAMCSVGGVLAHTVSPGLDLQRQLGLGAQT